MDRLEIAIVGAGVAGLAAAGRLISTGAKVVIFEASSRIGGRIHSERFNDCHVDVGAHWVGGEPIYSLASEARLIEDTRAFSFLHFVLADGQIIAGEQSKNICAKMKEFAEDFDMMKAFNGSLGDYFAQRFSECSQSLNLDANNLNCMISWVQRFKCLEHGCDNLCDVSTATLTKRGPRNKCAIFKSSGFTTLLPLLLGNHCNNQKLEEIIKLNCEVKKINWSNADKVTLTTSDGEVKCDLVLVTLPLSVMKQEQASLFHPCLPEINKNALDDLAMGTVDKIYLKFGRRWWPENNFSGFCFSTSLNPHDPCEWENSLIGIFAEESTPLILCGWVVGDCARQMEVCSDGEVVDRVSKILCRHLGDHYAIPPIEAVLRSKWNSDSKFRGSYSHIKNSCQDVNVHKKLSTPITNAVEKQVVFFAGEATSEFDFSTAHGAVESGWREARRITELYFTPIYHKIVIIGAGLAGLVAAKTLFLKGVKDFKVLEAQNNAGGRLITRETENGIIELGAQWAHFSASRMVEFASELGLALPLKSIEGSGVFFYPNGLKVPQTFVDEVHTLVYNALEECAKFYNDVNNENIPTTVEEFLNSEFEKYLKPCDDPEEMKLKKALYDWHVRFQLVDNSCNKLGDLSARLWGQFGDLGSEQGHINFAGGFSSLIKSLVNLLPRDALVTSCPVSKIKWGNAQCQIDCSDGRKFLADHVIITSSIGYLKANDHFFEPQLPQQYQYAIRNIGFGTINKIFLFYDEIWWDDLQGVQLAWNSQEPCLELGGKEMGWISGLTGFDPVASCPQVLVGWVGGIGAIECEALTEKTIGSHCTVVLRCFTGMQTIPEPRHVIRSRWNSNEFVRGAYSHLMPSSSTCQDILLEPVKSGGEERPVIFFAGEALHKKYYSTANGAYDCGETQANLLLDYLNVPSDNPADS